MTDAATFEAFASLMAIVTDPAATKKRLGELRAASEDLARREAALAADREAFEEHRRVAVADVEREREAVSQRLQRILDPRFQDYLRHRMQEAERAQAEGGAAA